MVQQFDSWITGVGPEAYAFLALAALIEYLFPPFPGDTIVLLAGVYAARGDRPWLWVFAAVTVGSILGSALAYGAGNLLSKKLAALPEGASFFGLSRARLEPVAERMRRHGTWLIAANRFLPAVRGLLFVAAGAARLPLKRVLVLGAVSALAWNALLVGAGMAVGGNAERLEGLLRTYHQAVWVLLGAVAAIWLTLRWRARSSAPPA